MTAVNATNNRLVRVLGLAAAALVGLGASGGCERNEMHQQPRVDELAPSKFYQNGQGSRLPPAGTVARGAARLDDAMFTGKVDGKLVDAFPFEVTKRVLDRGQERYNIYCSVCHGYLGDANGMIVQRGFTRPPSFVRNKPEAHMTEREKYVQTAPVGHFYDAITNGFGAMYSYSDRIKPEDRWAIVAYIRALQLSQRFPEQQLSEQDRQAMAQAQQNTGAAAAAAAEGHAPAAH